MWFLFQDYLEHYLDEKKVNLFQYLSSISLVGVKLDAYVIMFTARQIEQMHHYSWIECCLEVKQNMGS